MLLYDSFTIALRYSVKLPFSQFARDDILFINYLEKGKLINSDYYMALYTGSIERKNQEKMASHA